MNISVTEDINGQKYVRVEQEPEGLYLSRFKGWQPVQEPKTDVLDKIRTEIEEVINENKAIDSNNSRAQNIGLMWALQIIDKYKAESEEEV